MKIRDFSKILAISPQATYEHLRAGKQGKKRRITSILLYRFLLNANPRTIDFLLADDNFDNKERIKRDRLSQIDSAEAWYE